MDVLVNSGIVDTEIITKDDKKYNYLKISSDLLLKYKNTTLVTPVKLPIIVKPKEHSKSNLAGYLLNDQLFIDALITNKPISKLKTKIEEDNNTIYNAVNRLSSTPL